MSETKTPTWEDVRRIVDELKVQMHLASMDARDRWDKLQPRLAELENDLARGGERAGEFLAARLASVATALLELRDEIQHKLEERHPGR